MSDDRNLLQRMGIAASDGSSVASQYALNYDWNGMFEATSRSQDNVFESWWNASNTADRDFARQMLAQQYQNEWEAAPNQMELAKNAGINLNTAAGQILHGSSPSMSAPSTDAPEPLSGAASALGAVAGVPEQLANAGKSSAETSEIRKLLPIKAFALTNEANLTLENIGLTKANAQAVNIMNHYRPAQFQLDIARAKLMLPFMLTQMNLFNKQAESEVASAALDRQKIEESKASISLMDYQAGLLSSQTRFYNAQANRTNQIFDMVNRLGFDPYAGSVLMQVISDPNVTEDSANELFNNLLTCEFEFARMHFLGENNLDSNEGRDAFTLSTDKELAVGRGLIKAREEAEKAINKENRKGEFWNKTADKWIRVPSSAGFGPFSMSTQ